MMSVDMGRETEPKGTTGEQYAKLIKSNVHFQDLNQAKDGKGLFAREDSNIRQLVEKHHLLISSMAEITWHPKKTTLAAD